MNLKLFKQVRISELKPGMLLVNEGGYIFLIVSIEFGKIDAVNTTAVVRYCCVHESVNSIDYYRLGQALITTKNGVFLTTGIILQ